MVGHLQADATIVAVVDKFYERMMRDAEMVRFFSGVDMAKQRAKQATFVSAAWLCSHFCDVSWPCVLDMVGHCGGFSERDGDSPRPCHYRR